MPIVADDIEAYAEAHTTPPPAHLVAAHDNTRRLLADRAGMVTGAVEGRFLEMLVFALQPRLVVEIGTFTGYGALAMAAALPPGGRVVTCELDERHAAIARGHIAASPFADRVEVRLGPALDTIAALDGPFDLVFVDADKTGYRAYYEAVLPKLADRGIIAVDNVLWGGRVADPAADDESTVALREFNDAVVADPRVTCVMTTVRDGVTLIRKRPAG